MKVAVIGGTGTIGREVAARLAERHEVVVCARRGADHSVDIESKDSIRALFEAIAPVDAVICAAGEATFKPMDELSDDDYAAGFRYKLMGQVNLVRIGHPHVRDHGSFTLTSGMAARQPMAGGTAYGIVNAGVEGFVRAAALELPRGIRVNAVSPQWVDATLEAYGMDPKWGTSAGQVALGYVESVDGTMTGTVIDVGWRFDWQRQSISLPPGE